MELNLPKGGVPARVSVVLPISPGERKDYAMLEGAGCIKRFWVVPTRHNAHWETRRVMLRIYFDGSAVPSVSAPLGDFFGVMHGRPYYPINTEYLSVQAESGYTSYFEMPFATSARIELESDIHTTVYMMVDWHRYPGAEMPERMRFHAQWRRENPTESYGREYLMLDAQGEGRLVGFAYGVRLNDNEDRWSHGGADNIYIDGDGQEPAYLRGIGGEDTFGVGYGGALHPPETHLYQGLPFYVHEDTGEARPAQRLTGYRFYKRDELPFHSSIHMRFGCMKNDICSIVYWYQEGEAVPFCALPGFDWLLPGTNLPYDTTTSLASSGRWMLYGPYANADGQAMKDALPPEICAGQLGEGGHAPNSGYLTESSIRSGKNEPRKVEYDAFHNFVDFRHAFRPHVRGVSPTEAAAAVARCTLFSGREQVVDARIGWDDELLLRVNGKVILHDQHSDFRAETVRLPLVAGHNAVCIKLSNTYGTTYGGWCFSFRAVGGDGVELPCTGES